MRIEKIIFVLTALFCLCGCATKTKVEYVDREVVKYQTKVQHDTLIQNTHDSIYYSVVQRGDTVFATKYVEKIKFKDRIVVKTDTCFRDSINTQITEKVVEKQKIPKWCYFCLGICLIIIIFAIYKIVVWVRSI